MPVPSVITDLSQTAALNYPSGSDSPSTLDDVQRAHGSFVALLRDGKGFTNSVSVASSATTDIGGQNAMSVEITGTTTITSFGTNYNGPRFLRFTGALTLTHSSTLYLPGAANITTVAGDTCIAVPNQGSTGWNVIAYQLASVSPGKAITQSAGDNSTKVATTAYADAAAAAIQTIPSGTVITVAMSTAPTGYLKCNGAAVSRTTYAALFTAIGTTYGVGDGSTTFNLPELRGEFVRGWDDARGIDSGRALGSSQAGAFASHTHTMLSGYALNARTGVQGGGTAGVFADGGSTDTQATGGTETRPRNVALLYCIKY